MGKATMGTTILPTEIKMKKKSFKKIILRPTVKIDFGKKIGT